MSNLLVEATLRIRDQGGRMTLQRRLILETLEELGGHPTAEQIFELACQQDSSLNLSTVYRTLRWLEQEGLVSARRFDENDRQDRFDPALPVEHHHFICSICKRVIEFDDPIFKAAASRFEYEHQAKVTSASVVFIGVCNACMVLSKQEGKAGYAVS
jgi:Fe2+ or Zn2+ uptake regulation protein